MPALLQQKGKQVQPEEPVKAHIIISMVFVIYMLIATLQPWQFIKEVLRDEK